MQLNKKLFFAALAVLCGWASQVAYGAENRSTWYPRKFATINHHLPTPIAAIVLEYDSSPSYPQRLVFSRFREFSDALISQSGEKTTDKIAYVDFSNDPEKSFKVVVPHKYGEIHYATFLSKTKLLINTRREVFETEPPPLIYDTNTKTLEEYPLLKGYDPLARFPNGTIAMHKYYSMRREYELETLDPHSMQLSSTGLTMSYPNCVQPISNTTLALGDNQGLTIIDFSSRSKKTTHTKPIWAILFSENKPNEVTIFEKDDARFFLKSVDLHDPNVEPIMRWQASPQIEKELREASRCIHPDKTYLGFTLSQSHLAIINGGFVNIYDLADPTKKPYECVFGPTEKSARNIEFLTPKKLLACHVYENDGAEVFEVKPDVKNNNADNNIPKYLSIRSRIALARANPQGIPQYNPSALLLGARSLRSALLEKIGSAQFQGHEGQ